MNVSRAASRAETSPLFPVCLFGKLLCMILACITLRTGDSGTGPEQAQFG